MEMSELEKRAYRFTMENIHFAGFFHHALKVVDRERLIRELRFARKRPPLNRWAGSIRIDTRDAWQSAFDHALALLGAKPEEEK